MSFDIDIDTPSSFDPVSIFRDWTKASIVKDGQFRPHPCGVHPQSIARDPVTGLSAIPYEPAEDLGYFKIDFLHLYVYDHFKSREEIEELLKIEPNWTLMKSPSVVKQLFQLSKHYETVKAVSPKSVEEVADTLALIRPGKRFLMDKYLQDKAAARKYLYAKLEGEQYSFKKAHAIAYALVIQLQLHLIDLGISFSS